MAYIVKLKDRGRVIGTASGFTSLEAAKKYAQKTANEFSASQYRVEIVPDEGPASHRTTPAHFQGARKNPKSRHACGGTVLSAGGGDQKHLYCDRCGAFVYLLGRDVEDVELPPGTDRAANKAAFDNADDQSPAARRKNPKPTKESSKHRGSSFGRSTADWTVEEHRDAVSTHLHDQEVAEGRGVTGAGEYHRLMAHAHAAMARSKKNAAEAQTAHDRLIAKEQAKEANAYARQASGHYKSATRGPVASRPRGNPRKNHHLPPGTVVGYAPAFVQAQPKAEQAVLKAFRATVKGPIPGRAMGYIVDIHRLPAKLEAKLIAQGVSPPDGQAEIADESILRAVRKSNPRKKLLIGPAEYTRAPRKALKAGLPAIKLLAPPSVAALAQDASEALDEGMEALDEGMEALANPMRVQSLVFQKAKFTKAQAKKWAREHGYRFGSVDTTESTHRLRQADPDQFQLGSFRTQEFGKGVSAVIARPR